MINKIIIISFILFYATISFAAPFQSSTSLYSDEKAQAVGDIVTIYIVEQSTAQNNNLSHNQDENLRLDYI